MKTRYSKSMREILEEMNSPMMEAPEDKEPASPDEGSMATQQLEFIAYAADEIMQHINNGGEFPEWMQNKLSKVNGEMQSLHANINHENVQDQKENVAEARKPNLKSEYQIFHKDYSSAVQHALAVADARGFKVDIEDYERKVAFGPRKPSAGKTNSFNIALDGTKKRLNMQVYNMDNRGYELNMYIESVALDEATDYLKLAKDIEAYAKKNGGIDKNDFMKVAAYLNTIGKNSDVNKQGKAFKAMVGFINDLDTEPREWVITQLQKAGMVDKRGNLMMGEETEIVESHFKEGDKVQCIKSGMEGTVVAVDPDGKGKYYTVKRTDGETMKYSPDELKVVKEEVELEEKLKVSDGLGAWITDFKKSDAPQFKGKSDEEKKNMAIAAFTDAGGKLDEAYKTPKEAQAFEDGKKAARKGKKYDDNPFKKGTPEFLAWSKGHNKARMNEEGEKEQSPEEKRKDSRINALKRQMDRVKTTMDRVKSQGEKDA